MIEAIVDIGKIVQIHVDECERLKIDQSFVRDMMEDPNDLAILRSIVSLSEVFHIDLIAEGVETELHGQLLIWLGCTQAQGYAIARPMPIEQIDEWASSWRPPTNWAQAHCLHVNDQHVLSAYLVFSSMERASSTEEILKAYSLFERLDIFKQVLHWLDDEGWETQSRVSIDTLDDAQQLLHAFVDKIAIIKEQPSQLNGTTVEDMNHLCAQIKAHLITLLQEISRATQ